MGKAKAKSSTPLGALVPVYSLTLLLSAALLFAVQPMFGKMVLPLLGGTPAVWNTLMVFFQAALLGGYAYAHVTSRFLTIRNQAILHIVLLTICLLVLPIAVPAGWEPPKSENPAFWVLGLAAVAVGGPFFVLAGSAPMFQRWFAVTDHPDADNPYFLYAASNLGSLTTLLCYPLVFEPLMALTEQSVFWRNGFVALILMAAVSAFLVWPKGQHHADELKHDAKWKKSLPTWRRRLLWVMLAFIPSSLMLGVTLYVTTDVASVPLLWVIPLTLYLLTFVIVFARKPWLSHKKTLDIHMVVMLLFLFFLMAQVHQPVMFFVVHFTTFFFSALMCHWELSASKPEAAHLTEFYLWMSLGGVLGGAFNALAAPFLFNDAIEYFLVLAIACAFRSSAAEFAAGRFLHRSQTAFNDVVEKMAKFKAPVPEIMAGLLLTIAGTVIFLKDVDYTFSYAVIVVGIAINIKRPEIFTCGVLIVLLGLYNQAPTKFVDGNLLYKHRNFFGVLSVGDMDKDNLRYFFHGTTLHGIQGRAEEERLTPYGYYHLKSPLADVFAELDRRRQPGVVQKVADLGLGVGVAACYGDAERHFTFYEIDPAVAVVAENPELFTFLSDCGTPYNIVIGDGRLSIQDEEDGDFDLVFIDAFTSDNIPVHLITREAIELYLQKTKPGGLVVLHISNRFLNLERPIGAIAEDLGLFARAKFKKEANAENDRRVATSHFVVLAREEQDLGSLRDAEGWRPLMLGDKLRPWTDNYSNIVSVLWSSETLQTAVTE